MKRHLASALVLIGASMMSAPVFAADPMGAAPAGSTSTPAEKSGAAQGLTKEQIIGHALVDKNGAKVGTVKDLRTDAQGAATDLVVSVGSKDVLLPASEVQMASNDKIQTTLSAKEAKRLPAAKDTASPGSSPGGGMQPSGGAGGGMNSPTSPY